MEVLIQQIVVWLISFLIKREKGRIEDGSALANIKRLIGILEREHHKQPIPQPDIIQKPHPKPIYGKKILFVTKKRVDNYGISLGLINSANFTSKALSDNGLDTRVVNVIDGNSVDKQVYDYKPDVVIIEAIWVSPSKLEELAKKYSGTTWIVRIHSRLPFISGEGNAISTLKDYLLINCDNICISCNHLESCREYIVALGTRVEYLPNIYPLEPYKLVPVEKEENEIRICSFGAIRILKNQLLQATAAIAFADKLGKKLKFYINAGRVEHADSTLKNLRALFRLTPHELIECPWLPHDKFLELLAQMDISLNVSFSETFNIVTCDSIRVNVPIVVSKEISWTCPLFQANPNSIYDIFDKMKTAYKLKDDNLNKAYLCDFNDRNIKEWKYTLNA